ncbi:MAG: hypothetical protein KDB36_11175 [Acidimicrobiales bacterium]|nr:hypothetical protein [Acidimicrobiales bacterium]
MPPTRTRPVADGFVGLPVSLFYVTAPRRHAWRPARPTPPVDWRGVIDLRDDADTADEPDC